MSDPVVTLSEVHGSEIGMFVGDTTAPTTRAAAEAYVGGVCFKLGPPTLIGAELEWLTERDDDDHHARVDMATLVAALGVHAPQGIALRAGGQVTVEPGGQVEISSLPFDSVADLVDALRRDTRTLRAALRSRSLRAHAAAADVHRPPERILNVPRYRAMEAAFDRRGPFGRLMMCNTAAVQVSVDAGVDVADVVTRWEALHAIGPALVAAFACSPTLRGAPDGAWASQRMRTWLELDPARTTPVLGGPDPIAGYARWALDVPLLCVRTADDGDWHAPQGATFADWLAGALDDVIGRRPDYSDLDYHLTTLFPPVRARGHLEIRYLDAQPEGMWTTPIYAVAALMSSPRALADAVAVTESSAGRWRDAARLGLSDPDLRADAADLLGLAADHADGPSGRPALQTAARRVWHGLAPHQKGSYVSA